MAADEGAEILYEEEGLPVTGVLLIIRKTGDGLSSAMALDPEILRHGDIVDVVLRCEVQEVSHVPEDAKEPKGPQLRKQILHAQTAKVMENDVIGEALAEQERRVAERKQAAAEAKARAKGKNGPVTTRMAGEDPMVNEDGSLNPDAADPGQANADRLGKILAPMGRPELLKLADRMDPPIPDDQEHRGSRAKLITSLVSGGLTLADVGVSDAEGSDDEPGGDTEEPAGEAQGTAET